MSQANSATILAPDVEATQICSLHVTGVDCAEEVALVESALRKTGHVHDVRVNVITGRTVIGHDEQIGTQELIAAIDSTGLHASREHERQAEAGDSSGARLLSVYLSGVFTGAGLALKWLTTGLPPSFEVASFIAAVVAGGWFIAPKAVRSLRQRQLDMNVLMTVAVLGAAAIGEWAEAAAVVFLFSLAELLESYSVARARRAVESLLKLSPDTALLKRTGEFVEVNVHNVVTGDVVRVRSGARIPLDGEVIDGTSAVNQAPITGESLPVEKKPGDTVYAGTINGEGSLDLRVTEEAGNTTLSKIIRLVEEAQEQKAPAQRFVDRFARIYTPAVMILAVLVCIVPGFVSGDWQTWFYRSLVLLVIACPCALVISTPVSVVSGLTAMARRGVLIKGGAWLEALGKLRAIAVDKTGTITQGRPQVQSVEPLATSSTEEVLRIAAALDAHSDHPLAQAVVAYAQEQKIVVPNATHYQSRAGRGAEGSVDGHDYFVGNHRFTHELGVCTDDLEQRLHRIEEQGFSVVIAGHKPHDACDGEALGVIAVGDTIRPEAKQAIESLHQSGIDAVIMLSGDNQTTVDVIAKEAGIDHAVGDLLPNDKIERVRELLSVHRHVGMIGDGVNDAPAMAAATVGIAMGAAGTDTAIETADIALMADDLTKVADSVRLGRRTLRIIQFNIAFAILVKAAFLLLAVFGLTSLWLAILADTGATLLVIANSLRLLHQPEES